MVQVWEVNGDQLSILPSEGVAKLFSGHCYIVKYVYPGSQRDEIIFYAWFGIASTKVKTKFLGYTTMKRFACINDIFFITVLKCSLHASILN